MRHGQKIKHALRSMNGEDEKIDFPCFIELEKKAWVIMTNLIGRAALVEIQSAIRREKYQPLT